MTKLDGTKLNSAMAHFVAGDVRGELLPEIASAALQEGFDSPSLRRLAGSKGEDLQDLKGLFERSLAEMNLALPNRSLAVRLLAGELAREIIGGQVDPIDGARRIRHRLTLSDLDLDPHAREIGQLSVEADDVCESLQVDGHESGELKQRLTLLKEEIMSVAQALVGNEEKK